MVDGSTGSAGSVRPSSRLSSVLQRKGGASAALQGTRAPGFTLSSLWGVLGVLAVLGNAVRRLLPIALEPFKLGDFTRPLWGQYVAFALFMAYAEGYKGFHLKFSPLVVRRAYTLGPDSPLLHKVLAAPYSMGLFHASRKRKIVSWGLAVGIFGLIRLVKSLAYPYRSIVDAGVVVGLTLGATSIAGHYVASLFGRLPDIDAALPEGGKQQ